MAYDPSYRRRWSVTLLRALASILGFGIVGVVATGVFGGTAFDVNPVDLVSQNVALLGWLTLVPLVWALTGGVVGDHLLARRGPWWPFLLHTVGLCISAILILFGMAVVSMSQDGSPVAILAAIWVIFIPFISIPGVAVTWLIPGSFPRTVTTAPSDLATGSGAPEYMAPWQPVPPPMQAQFGQAPPPYVPHVGVATEAYPAPPPPYDGRAT